MLPDDKRVYVSLSLSLWPRLPFYCRSTPSQSDESESRAGSRCRMAIGNVYRAHSIRNNNDLSAIRCKMSARSARDYARAGDVPGELKVLAADL